MKEFHMRVSVISRSSGGNALQHASYTARANLHSEKYGESYDYFYKDDLVYEKVYLPENAPEEYLDREKLWNSVENFEKNSNAQLMRTGDLAIPESWDSEQIKSFCDWLGNYFTKQGMCADISVHMPHEENKNVHIHYNLTMRAIGENGEWLPKSKKEYILDENENKIVLKNKDGTPKKDSRNRIQYKTRKVTTQNWDERETLKKWRADVCAEINKNLDKEKQIDHRSFKERGIDKIPQYHLPRKEFNLLKKLERQLQDKEISEQKFEESLTENLKRFIDIREHNKVIESVNNLIEKENEKVVPDVPEIEQTLEETKDHEESRLEVEQKHDDYIKASDKIEKVRGDVKWLKNQINSIEETKSDIDNYADTVKNLIEINEIEKLPFVQRNREVTQLWKGKGKLENELNGMYAEIESRFKWKKPSSRPIASAKKLLDEVRKHLNKLKIDFKARFGIEWVKDKDERERAFWAKYEPNKAKSEPVTIKQEPDFLKSIENLSLEQQREYIDASIEYDNALHDVEERLEFGHRRDYMAEAKEEHEGVLKQLEIDKEKAKQASKTLSADNLGKEKEIKKIKFQEIHVCDNGAWFEHEGKTHVGTLQECISKANQIAKNRG